MSTAADVTVVVPVKDRRALFAACLAGLAQGAVGVHEIIVVDNSSSDGTYELALDAAERSSIPMRVLRADRPSGPARNDGLAHVATELVAFVDSDCVPQAGWIEALVAAFSDPAVGVVQGRTVPDPAVRRERWAVTQQIEGPTPLFEACNIAYRTDALRRAGGFAEHLGFFCEDTVAGWTVMRDGATRSFSSAAVVHHAVTHPGLGWHLHRASLYSNWPQAMKEVPSLGNELLFAGVFLRRSHLLLLLAIAGLVASPLTRRSLVLVLPYLVRRRPPGWRPGQLVDWAGGVAFEVRVVAALAAGSTRARRVVL